MLKDRIVLLDQEVDKLKAHCGSLYRQIAIDGNTALTTEYDQALAVLAKLLTEQIIINDMLIRGHA
jgi:hypothetical protein